MHHAAFAKRDADVCHSLVGTIGEEQQIRGRELADVSSCIASFLRLLPRVARELKSVQRERALHETGAVGAPGSYAAPEVTGGAEIVFRRTRDGQRFQRKTLGEMRRGDRFT